MNVPPGGLTCFEVLAQLSDLLDGTLAAPQRQQVEVHVAGCGDCARFGGAVAKVIAGLRAGALATQDANETLPGAVASRLDAAWRRVLDPP